MTVGILPNTARGASHRHTSDPNAPPAASFSMRVSSKAHYGLRMMTEFAKSYGAGPLSIAEVARVEHLPLAYLEQLASQLRRGGLVEIAAVAGIDAQSRWIGCVEKRVRPTEPAQPPAEKRW